MYINEDSPKQLPLTINERQDIFENFNKLKLSNGIQNLEPQLGDDSDEELIDIYEIIFSVAQEIQFIEIFRDVFPRYLRSKRGSTDLSAYSSNPKVMQTKQQAQFPYTREDFQRIYVTQKDYDFMTSLMKDDLNWELRKI